MPASSSASWRRWSRRAVAAMIPSTCRARIVCESSSSRSGSLSVLAISGVYPAVSSRSSMPRRIGGKSGLVRSGISTPIVYERLVFSPRAIGLGW